MRVLIACEESQTICKAFRSLGHEAYSCDLQRSSGGHPEWHIIGDAIEALNSQKWDLVIAHPPCDYISNMSNCRIKEPGRLELRKAGMDFFMEFANYDGRIAIENPRGLPEREYRKPDQIIQPYQFGHKASKQTCLWLKGLPALNHTKVIEPIRKWDGKRWRTWVDSMGSQDKKLRSKTFLGIAKAMADQWGGIV